MDLEKYRLKPTPDVKAGTDTTRGWFSPRSPEVTSGLDVKSKESYKPSFPFDSSKDITKSSSPIVNPLPQVAKTVGNIPSSTINMVKDITSLVTSPIQTIKGVKGLVAGAIQKLTPGVQADEKMVDALVQNYKDRYGSYENLKRTIVNDPMGFGSELFSAIQLGAGIAGKTAQLNKAVSATAKPVIKTAGKVTAPLSSAYNNANKLVAKLRNKAFGGISGLGEKNIETALKGDPDYMKAVRGTLNEDDILRISNEAKTSLESNLSKIKLDKSTKYGQAQELLESIKTPVRANALANDFADWGKTNLKFADDVGGKIDFSKTKFRTDPAAKVAIQEAYDILSDLPEEIGALQLDETRKMLSNLYPNSGSAKSLIGKLTDSAKNTLEKLPEYKNMTAEYKTAIAAMDDVEDALKVVSKLLDSADSKKAIKKLTEAVRKNPENREVIFRILSEQQGRDITSTMQGLAAREAVSPVTKSLVRYLGIGTAFGKFNPKLLLLGALSSPRITSELFNLIGKYERTMSKVGPALAGLATAKNISPGVVPAVTAAKQVPFLNKKAGQLPETQEQPTFDLEKYRLPQQPQETSGGYNMTNMLYLGQEGARPGVPKPNEPDSNFASFDTEEDNIKAVGRDIELKLEKNPNMTLKQLINIWSPAVDENNPNQILKTILDELYKKHYGPGDSIIYTGNTKVRDIISNPSLLKDFVYAVAVAEHGDDRYRVKTW